MDWNKILNWRLLSGSHKFPGPDGGTCINEAAIIAAGFQYSPIHSANDCPPCFSRVFSSYAISLNDHMPDDLRQSLLLPFVTRLAGTADTPEIERQRFDFIILGIVCKGLPFLLRGWKDDLAAECATVANYNDAIKAINNIARDRHDLVPTSASARARALVLDLVLARDLILALAGELVRARDLTLDAARAIGSDLSYALALARAIDLANDLEFARYLDLHRYALFLDPVDDPRDRHTALVALLDGAMKIGKQADPIDVTLIVDRLAKIRTLKHGSTGSAVTT